MPSEPRFELYVATSLPDAFVSIRAARRGAGVTSVLGSNTFNLLLAVPLMGFLGVATTVFLVCTRTDLELTNGEATAFLALYGGFLFWMALETAGAVQTLRGI